MDGQRIIDVTVDPQGGTFLVFANGFLGHVSEGPIKTWTPLGWVGEREPHGAAAAKAGFGQEVLRHMTAGRGV
jgi:hypothetical protein